MALKAFTCAGVPLRSYSLTLSVAHSPMDFVAIDATQPFETLLLKTSSTLKQTLNLNKLILKYCWLGHQTCKNRRPYNLYCVGADVKPCSINQSIKLLSIAMHGHKKAMHIKCDKSYSPDVIILDIFCIFFEWSWCEAVISQ